jgi:hypothetical protein
LPILYQKPYCINLRIGYIWTSRKIEGVLQNLIIPFQIMKSMPGTKQNNSLTGQPDQDMWTNIWQFFLAKKKGENCWIIIHR